LKYRVLSTKVGKNKKNVIERKEEQTNKTSKQKKNEK